MAHKFRVMRLYRHSLKQMMSWAIQRSLIYEEFKNIRAQFEKNMNVVSTAKEGLSEGKPRRGRRHSKRSPSESTSYWLQVRHVALSIVSTVYKYHMSL